MTAFPKPERRHPAARKRLNAQRASRRAKLVRQLDATCSVLVKSLAGYRCEWCGKRGPLDWAHGEGRAQVWALRWSHDTFSLCRECHRRSEWDSTWFGIWRETVLSSRARMRIAQLAQERPHVDEARMQDILIGLRRGIFLQGER